MLVYIASSDVTGILHMLVYIASSDGGRVLVCAQRTTLYNYKYLNQSTTLSNYYCLDHSHVP